MGGGAHGGHIGEMLRAVGHRRFGCFGHGRWFGLGLDSYGMIHMTYEANVSYDDNDPCRHFGFRSLMSPRLWRGVSENI